MLFTSVVKAALVATALAQPVQHHHQHHQHQKKDVITRTVVVTEGADDDSTATEAPVAFSSSVVASSSVVTNAGAANVNPVNPVNVVNTNIAATAATTTPAAASPVAVTTATTATTPVAATTATTATSKSSSASVPASTGSFSAKVKGITYSPYAADGTCKSASQVKSEVQRLSGYEVIRLYGVDCNQVENVLAGMSSSQKLFAGIYFVDAITEGVATLAAAVEAANGWGQVHTVSIGNELVNAGAATVSQIQSYVNEGRAALTAAGYTGPVVSVDTFIAIYTHKGLCDVSDYIAANAHAYFDGGVTADNAGTWVSQQYQGLINTCPGKEVLIVESGWPTQGDTNGKAVAGVAEQTAALNDIASKVSDHVFYFNAYNDLWKADGYLQCEKYWGVFSS